MGMSLRSCEMDVRVGGKYRLEFEPDGRRVSPEWRLAYRWMAGAMQRRLTNSAAMCRRACLGLA